MSPTSSSVTTIAIAIAVLTAASVGERARRAPISSKTSTTKLHVRFVRICGGSVPTGCTFQYVRGGGGGGVVGELRTVEAVLALLCAYGWRGGRDGRGLIFKNSLNALLWMCQRVETGGVALLVWLSHSFLGTYRIPILDRYSIDCHR